MTTRCKPDAAISSEQETGRDARRRQGSSELYKVALPRSAGDFTVVTPAGVRCSKNVNTAPLFDEFSPPPKLVWIPARHIHNFPTVQLEHPYRI